VDSRTRVRPNRRDTSMRQWPPRPRLRQLQIARAPWEVTRSAAAKTRDFLPRVKPIRHASLFAAAFDSQRCQRCELRVRRTATQIATINAEMVSFASSRSGVRIPLAPPSVMSRLTFHLCRELTHLCCTRKTASSQCSVADTLAASSSTFGWASRSSWSPGTSVTSSWGATWRQAARALPIMGGVRSAR